MGMPIDKKYRPYFTRSEFVTIITALQEKPTSERMQLIQYLNSFIVKMNHGVIAPALQITGTKNEQLKNGLGLGLVRDASMDEPSTYWNPEELLKRWNAGEILTAAELTCLQEYRFKNDLMTEKEENDYLAYNGMA